MADVDHVHHCAGSADAIDFSRDVAPIFQQHCAECHGSDKREGGLRLTGRAELLLRADSGEPAVVAGSAATSELIRRVTATAESGERMPPEGPGLGEAEVSRLRRWIDAGAEWPASEPGPRHWAYVAPQRPAVVESPDDHWSHNAIDRLVLRRLRDEGLTPAPAAEPARLIRRVTLDLIGLPPTLEAVDDFVADPSQERYARYVDELLASPRYGEKWARHWLDLARYADSNGYQADQFRDIWAWRDWVINAMNNDLPYDQFTISQLAGDLLPDATIDQRVATGFHRCTTCNVEAGVDPEENRVNQLIDRVNTTGTVWLGTTLECAQCHNHKYDPFTQQDYYQLLAFFNGTPLEVERPGDAGVQYEVAGPKLELPLTPEQQAQADAIDAERTEAAARVAARREQLGADLASWENTLRSQMEAEPTWHVLPVREFVSAGGGHMIHSTTARCS
ncbi:MAG: DUF1549 domain-containing protein [Planctomycetaceae bacterium]